MSRKHLRAYLGLAALMLSSTVAVANAETLPLKKLSVDGSKQLVVEFGGTEGAFPAAPHLLDLPGPNHRVVFDFTDASIDKANLAASDELSAAIGKTLPFIKSVRYSDLENVPSPTARLVLDLPEDLKLKPRVVKMEQGSVTISLGDADIINAACAAAAPAQAAPVASSEQPVSDVNGKQLAAANTGDAWDWAEKGGNSVPANAPASISSNEAAVDASPVLAPAIADASVSSPEATMPAAEAVVPAPEAMAPTTEVAELKPAISESSYANVPQGYSGEAINSPSLSAPAAQANFAPQSDATASSAPVAPVSESDKKFASVKHYNAAVQLHLQGKLTEAINEYKASLESNQALSEAHSNLGLIFNQQHNYAQALAEFRKALAVNPKDAITYNGIGAALRAEKDLQGAIKNWQTAVSLDPKLATAHYNLGTAYEIEKEYDKALASYTLAVRNDYRLGEAYYRMGLIMERKRRPEDAAEQFKEALKVSSDSEYSEDARQRLAYLTQSKKGAAAKATK